MTSHGLVSRGLALCDDHSEQNRDVRVDRLES
jgi:hypothetical protein